MNQPSAITSIPRGTPSDAPDLLFVLRHYRWLIIIGTILGTLAGLGIYSYIRKTSPRYSASVTFQVGAPRSALDSKTTDSASIGTLEEVNRLIKRQGVLIEQDNRILDKALEHEAFQRDRRDPKNPKAKSRFLTKNNLEPKKALQEAVAVSPIGGTEVFKITMTTDDNEEAANMVNAIALVYTDRLREQDKESQAVRLKDLKTSQKTLEEEIRIIEATLADFTRTANIGRVTTRHQIEMDTLSTLKSALLNIEIEVSSAQSSYENIKKQVENGTLQLTTDLEMYVENDPQVRMLENQKLSLVQDKEVLQSNTAALTRQTLALNIRIAATSRMIDERREELRAKARLRMQEGAETRKNSLTASAEDMRNRVKEKELQVKDLDNLLVQYQNKKDALTGKQRILQNISDSIDKQELEAGTDYARIRRLGGDAVAPLPEDVSYPKLPMFLIPGILGGFALSFGLGYLLELTNTRVRTPRDITRSVQLPLLGFVPDQEDDASLAGDLATAIRTSPMSMMAESFRQVRGRLAAQADGKPLSTLLVASIAPSGGASTIASNLANGMALNDMRVLLVDANFYRPSLNKTYKNIPQTGFSDILVNPADLDASIVPCADMPRLHLLGAGNKPTIGATELLESKTFRDILEQLKKRYDIIIFDGAPLSLVGDSISLASKVDGVVAIVRAGVVSRGTVGRVRDQLRQVRANLLGVVLNAAQTHGAGYFKQNYRTFYEYAGQTDRNVASK